MLFAVDALLHRIEPLPEHGCYSVTFMIDASRERSVVMKVAGDNIADGTGETEAHVIAPEANMLPGWSTESNSNRSVLDAVLAFHRARSQVDGGGAVLRDVPGGWDVGVGNVTLDDAGRPACAAHGELDLVESVTYECATCGARALYGASND